MFFVDVGQGDGALIECPQGVIVVDGGRGSAFHSFLRHRYRAIFDEGKQVHIKAMIVSHPDYDHYNGLQPILRDNDFTVGQIYHNGLMRYPEEIEDDEDRMVQKDYLSSVMMDGGAEAFFLTETIDDFDSILKHMARMSPGFRSFWSDANKARKEGRLQGAARLWHDAEVEGFGTGEGLRLKVLGPVLTALGGAEHFIAFGDPTYRTDERPSYPGHGYSHSHTRNGHSIVLRLEFGNHSILLGGDLNIPAQQHLMDELEADRSQFRVDVAKACHHGSADFSPEFLQWVEAQASVISSGESYDHPTPDAVGALARHGRGSHPLLFSTELARASGSRRIHYGLINLRSNGETLTMAQMKEEHRRGADVWDSYTVPWHGKFWYERSREE
ncbi:MAG: MBL fold metallo-hydrolase [Gemmatimonadota bacterium]|nr:MBL fold metallo-hydrolase [Gemmatimonadota bacterium]